jgi:hypothetical protein
MALLVFVVPLAFATDPGEYVAVALDGRRQRLDGVDDGACLVVRNRGLKSSSLVQFVSESMLALPRRLASAFSGIKDIPPDLLCVLHHRELD